MSGRALGMLGAAHGSLVHGRRVEALARAFLPLCEPGWHVLDVGCGDGQLGALLQDRGRDVRVEGLEFAPRSETKIPVQPFDGKTIPLAENSVDAVMMVDVLHHTEDARVLLREACRVARRAVLLKDHRTARPLALVTLRMMDWVGNKPHGVVLPYNYWSEARWREAWDELGLAVESFQTGLGLYPVWARWLFESGLHFVARLGVSGSGGA